MDGDMKAKLSEELESKLLNRDLTQKIAEL